MNYFQNLGSFATNKLKAVINKEPEGSHANAFPQLLLNLKKNEEKEKKTPTADTPGNQNENLAIKKESEEQMEGDNGDGWDIDDNDIDLPLIPSQEEDGKPHSSKQSQEKGPESPYVGIGSGNKSITSPEAETRPLDHDQKAKKPKDSLEDLSHTENRDSEHNKAPSSYSEQNLSAAVSHEAMGGDLNKQKEELLAKVKSLMESNKHLTHDNQALKHEIESLKADAKKRQAPVRQQQTVPQPNQKTTKGKSSFDQCAQLELLLKLEKSELEEQRRQLNEKLKMEKEELKSKWNQVATLREEAAQMNEMVKLKETLNTNEEELAEILKERATLHEKLRFLQDECKIMGDKILLAQVQYDTERDQIQTQMEKKQKEHDEQINKLKSEHNREFTQSKEHYEHTLLKLHDDYKAQMNSLKKELQNEISTLNSTAHNEKETLTKENTKLVSELKKDHQNQMKEVQAKYETQVEQLKKTMKKLEEDKKKQLSQMKERSKKIIQQLVKNVSGMKQEIQETKSEMKSLRDGTKEMFSDCVGEMKEKISEISTSLINTKSLLKKSTDENKKLRDELDQAVKKSSSTLKTMEIQFSSKQTEGSKILEEAQARERKDGETIKRLTNEIQKAKEEREKMVRDHTVQMQNLEDRSLSRQKAELKSAKDSQAKQAEELSKLKASQSTFENQIETLREKLTASETENKSLLENLNKFKSRFENQSEAFTPLENHLKIMAESEKFAAESLQVPKVPPIKILPKSVNNSEQQRSIGLDEEAKTPESGKRVMTYRTQTDEDMPEHEDEPKVESKLWDPADDDIILPPVQVPQVQSSVESKQDEVIPPPPEASIVVGQEAEALHSQNSLQEDSVPKKLSSPSKEQSGNNLEEMDHLSSFDQGIDIQNQKEPIANQPSKGELLDIEDQRGNDDGWGYDEDELLVIPPKEKELKSENQIEIEEPATKKSDDEPGSKTPSKEKGETIRSGSLAVSDKIELNEEDVANRRLFEEVNDLDPQRKPKESAWSPVQAWPRDGSPSVGSSKGQSPFASREILSPGVKLAPGSPNKLGVLAVGLDMSKPNAADEIKEIQMDNIEEGWNIEEENEEKPEEVVQKEQVPEPIETQEKASDSKQAELETQSDRLPIKMIDQCNEDSPIDQSKLKPHENVPTIHESPKEITPEESEQIKEKSPEGEINQFKSPEIQESEKNKVADEGNWEISEEEVPKVEEKITQVKELAEIQVKTPPQTELKENAPEIQGSDHGWDINDNDNIIPEIPPKAQIQMENPEHQPLEAEAPAKKEEIKPVVESKEEDGWGIEEDDIIPPPVPEISPPGHREIEAQQTPKIPTPHVEAQNVSPSGGWGLDNDDEIIPPLPVKTKDETPRKNEEVVQMKSPTDKIENKASEPIPTKSPNLPAKEKTTSKTPNIFQSSPTSKPQSISFGTTPKIPTKSAGLNINTSLLASKPATKPAGDKLNLNLGAAKKDDSKNVDSLLSNPIIFKIPTVQSKK